MTVGDRIRQARELHGLTQTQLGNLVGVSQPVIAKAETRGAVSDDVLSGVAAHLGFPEVWFRREPVLLSEGTLRNRAHARTRSTDRATARRQAELAVETYLHLSRDLRLPTVRVPTSVETPDDLETAALDVRAALGEPPDQPIRNVTRTLERGGVMLVVLPLSRESGQDAFSTRLDDDRPLVALLRGSPPDRLRHSLAHELGHLVLHSDAPVGSRESEREADRFAGAFLLPKEPALNELDGPFTMERLLELKQRWGVAIRAIIVRAHHLELISDRTYQRWFRTLNKRYGGRSEPGGQLVADERPRAMAQMAEMTWGALKASSLVKELHYAPLVAASLVSSYQQGRDDRSVDDDAERLSNVTPLRREG